MNVDLLRKIQAHILEESKRVDMRSWGEIIPKKFLRKKDPQCGTVACIAGWACLLEKHKLTKKEKAHLFVKIKKRIKNKDCKVTGLYIDAQKIAERLLGLKSSDTLFHTSPGDNLFYVSNWPRQFREALSHTKNGTKKYAKIVAARIEDYIKENECT